MARGIAMPAAVKNSWSCPGFRAALRVGGSRAGAVRHAGSALVAGAFVLAALFSCLCIYGCMLDSGPATSWLMGAPERQGESCVLQLTERQRAEAARATYTLFKRDATEYSVLIWKAPADIDEQGNVVVPANPDVVALQVDGEGGPIAVSAEYADADDGCAAYEIFGVGLDASPDLGPSNSMAGHDSVSIEAAFRGDEASASTVRVKRTRPLAAYPMGEEVTEEQMGLYRGLSYVAHGPVLKTRADDGSLAPVSEWALSAQAASPQAFDFEGKLQVVRMPTSGFAGDFFVQVVVEDVEGNHHGSDLMQVDVPSHPAAESFEVPTGRGALTFERAGDHAILRAYEGEDGLVEIPSEAGGLPVTTIGDRAFAGNEYVNEVILPKTVTDIGHEAFRGSRFERIALPPHVGRIGNAAFAYMRNLGEFALQGQSNRFSVRDGVLYSADGSRLIAYPSAKGATFEVPDGVEELAYAAFAGARVERVGLPESLREIAPCAFAGCRALVEVAFPDSLERIGSCAFGLGDAPLAGQSDGDSKQNLQMGNAPASEVADARAPVQRIRIGQNVAYVGRDAFAGLALLAIEVDPGNRRYRSEEGFLISAENTLLQAPSSIVSPVEVPVGVRALAEGSLAHIESAMQSPAYSELALADVFLHSSVHEIEQGAFSRTKRSDSVDGRDQLVCGARIHAPAGSWAAGYAREQGIRYDSAHDVDGLRMDVQVVATPSADLTFRVFGDHAELSRITVTETFDVAGHVEIPAQVEGVPVTKLGGDARDMAKGTVATLVIPPSVREVDARFLSHLYGLRTYEVSDESKWLSARDGVLFSDDGTVLLAYPRTRGGMDLLDAVLLDSGFAWLADEQHDLYSDQDLRIYDGQNRLVSAPKGHGSTYAIPDGTREIADYAFFGADVTDVVFPEGLERIGSNAFAWCERLGDVAFPSSLRYVGNEAFYLSGVRSIRLNEGLRGIGALAFAGTQGCVGLSIPSSVTVLGSQAFFNGSSADGDGPGGRTLFIGRGLSRLGITNPFATVNVEAFAVAGRNRSLKSDGPLLLSKDGRVLYACATAAAGEVHIPEGVEAIKVRSFYRVNGLTDLYVPDSVTQIAEDAFSYDRMAFTMHCSPGSEAALFADSHGIPHTP